MAHIIKSQAFVLNTRPFRESSLFASILTRAHGKVTVLAKGIRRPRSKLCGTMERFNLDEVIYYKRESKEAYTLSDATIINEYRSLRQNPLKVNAAMVMCEFFDKTLPHEETNTEAFRLLNDFLEVLSNSADTHVRQITMLYLIKSLPSAGVKPHLDSCVKCYNPVLYSAKEIDFSTSAGGIVCERDFDDSVVLLSRNAVNTLKKIFQHDQSQVSSDALLELESIIPDYLYYHLNNLVLNALKHLK